MKEEKETRQKLLQSAKQEFMEKGYMKASLRNICKNAGVTTGALYFFFRDKEDLFSALVEEPLAILFQIMLQHYEQEKEEAEERKDIASDSVNHYEAARQLIHFLYQYYDECMLLITKSQGSKYENCIEQFVILTEQHYRSIMEQMAQGVQSKPVDDYMLHWLAHTEIDIFVYLLTHERSEQAAISHMEPIVRYMLAGWKGLFF